MTNPHINSAGDKSWRNAEGDPHRTDGPAVEFANNSNKAWWINGKRHREDGPAVEYTDGIKEWWVCDEKLTKQQFDSYIKSLTNILNINYE